MKGFDLRKLFPRRAAAFLAAGLAVWVIACVLAGPGAVFASAARGFRAFGTVMALSAAALAFRAAAWKIAIGRPDTSPNNSKDTPLLAVLVATMGLGTPVRLALLRKKTGIADGAGSVAADRAVGSLAGMIFVGLALFVGFLFVPGNALVRGLMLIAAIGGLGYVLVATRRRGFFTAILSGWPSRIVSPAVRGRFEERDRFLRNFRAGRPAAFHASLLIHLAVFGLGALEILAVGGAIDAYFPPALALGLAALIPVFRLVFSFIPGALGALEASLALILGFTFGAELAPLGLSLVLVLRVRTLVWWLAGLAAGGNPLRLLFAR